MERNRSPSPGVAQPEITSSGRITHVLPRETWLAPNVIGAWGVTTLSADRAGDESWVAGIELATARAPPAQEALDLGALP